MGAAVVVGTSVVVGAAVVVGAGVTVAEVAEEDGVHCEYQSLMKVQVAPAAQAVKPLV